MGYVWAEYTREAKELSFYRYVAEVSRLAGENIAAIAHGSYIASKWDTEPKKGQPEQDGDAIAADIIRRAGLSFKGTENESV